MPHEDLFSGSPAMLLQVVIQETSSQLVKKNTKRH
jgi:hypothetical protein